jgi:hypothetical protein
VLETAPEILVYGKLVLEHLYGDKPVEPVAPCLIYNRHSADADFFDDLIPVVKQLADVFVHAVH